MVEIISAIREDAKTNLVSAKSTINDLENRLKEVNELLDNIKNESLSLGEEKRKIPISLAENWERINSYSRYAFHDERELADSYNQDAIIDPKTLIALLIESFYSEGVDILCTNKSLSRQIERRTPLRFARKHIHRLKSPHHLSLVIDELFKPQSDKKIAITCFSSEIINKEGYIRQNSSTYAFTNKLSSPIDIYSCGASLLRYLQFLTVGGALILAGFVSGICKYNGIEFKGSDVLNLSAGLAASSPVLYYVFDRPNTLALSFPRRNALIYLHKEHDSKQDITVHIISLDEKLECALYNFCEKYEQGDLGKAKIVKFS
jgi:hypothetical protein